MKYLFYFLISIRFFNIFCAQETFETVDVNVEVVVDHSAELPCNVTSETEDDKLDILAWYRDNSSTAFYSRDFRADDDVKASLPSSRYQLVAAKSEGVDKLQITAVKPSDAGVYHCLADFASSPAHKTYVRLFVIEPPQSLWIVHKNGTGVANATTGANSSRNIGPYYVGDTVRLFCVVFGGKPLPSLTWRAEQRLLKESSTPLSEHRVRSELTYGPLQREDHGLVLSCAANNTGHMSPLTIDVTIDMLLPPELVSLRATSGVESTGGQVRSGTALRAQCRVLGARPLPSNRVLWRLNNRELNNLKPNITMEPSQRLVVNEIQLMIDHQYDESSITCCAPAHRRNDDGYICSEPLHLTVYYPPIIKIDVDGDLKNTTISIVKGSNITMNCTYQANPSIYQLIWFHEEDIITHDQDSIERTLQPILELQALSESAAGEYVCAATNDEGSTYSDPITIDITYPAYCEDESIAEYGLDEGEFINITCNMIANPKPTMYRWVLVDTAVNITTFRPEQARINLESEDNVLLYERPKHTPFSTILCWGINNVPTNDLSNTTPCTFRVTDETVPRPPTNCVARQNEMREISITCDKGHDGGLQQNFTFAVKALDSEEQLLSIINQEPKFIIQEPKYENYKFIVMASNSKGNSKMVEIDKENIKFIEPGEMVSAVSNITTLTLALCGGVALVALAACGLVLCAHDRSERDRDRDHRTLHDQPPLCAYNTEESNCETYNDSDEGSECNVRRTESFRRAVSKYPSNNYDVRRTSSFHSARYMNDTEQDNITKYNDALRHSASCRIHSMQNINRKRDMDVLCDHLIMHIPPETNYNAPSKPMNTFYTMPRKTRHKLAKELSDDRSEITQTSDGFSLPPPPDEFGTYRAGTRIKDIPSKPVTPYTSMVRKNSTGKEPKKQQSITSPINTVGLPTVSRGHSVYTYPDDESHGHQTAIGFLTTV